MHIVFLICALSTGIYAIVVWWKVPETLPSDIKEQSGIQGRSPASPIRLREHKLLLWITLSAMPVTLLYAQVESTFPLHLQTRFENFQTIYATLMTFNGLTVILLQIWIARKTKDFPVRWIMAVSYALFAAVSLGYGFAPWFAMLLAVELIFTIGEMLNGPHMQKLVSVIAPPEHRGLYFSIFGMNWQLARAIGPLLGGLILSRLNGECLFALLAFLIAAGGCSMFVLGKKMAESSDAPECEAARAPSADAPA